MRQSGEFTQRDYDQIRREYADLLGAARKRCTEEGDLEIVGKAFEFANSAHKGVRRRSGEPYILHSIAVAKIVVQVIGLGAKSICAALLHDVIEDTSYTIEDLSALFGSKIASLVEGLAKIKTVIDDEENRPGGSSEIQDDEFRRVLLTLNDDVRVVLVKMADRLHCCRTIEYAPEYKREKVLSETMEIFIPLAHHLGLYGIKSEMENIWLRFKEPQAYNYITTRTSSDKIRGEKFVDDFLIPVREALDKEGLNYTITKRVKTPYSIWYKMTNKHVGFEDISDLYAARIIFTPRQADVNAERDTCYRIFNIIASIYDYRRDRVRDWLSSPKNNGYEALHLTAISPEGTNVEVQIRSKRMDEIAEKGIAAHWNYKRICPQTSESSLDRWILDIKEILNDPDINSLDRLDIAYDNKAREIVVFDTQGEQYRITKGMTAMDFCAMKGIDTGEHAVAAKVNYRLVPLTTVLSGGDKVEIITIKL